MEGVDVNITSRFLKKNQPKSSGSERNDGGVKGNTGRSARARSGPAGTFSARRVAWVGAVVVVGFVLALLYFRLSSGNPASPEYWIPSGRGVLELRSQAPDVDDEFWAGISAYEAGDLDRAIAYLATSDVRGDFGNLRNLYMASAMTLAGQHERALRTLSRIDASALSQPWRDEMGWIRYTALEGMGSNVEAERLLDELAGLDSFIGELARERKRLLKK